MAQFLQSLNPPPKIVHLTPSPPPPPPPPPAQIIHRPRLPLTRCKLSRRDLAFASASTSLSLFLPTFFFCPPQANADDVKEPSDQEAEPIAINNSDCGSSQQVTKKAFLDISIDGEPAGRIVVGLYGGGVPLGSSRFASMVSGAAGVSYRRKEFVKIVENYVQHGGVRSYGVDAEIAQSRGGDLAADSLVSEWEAAQRRCPPGETRNAAGSLGIIVRDPTKPPPKIKLVARGGKLEVDQEEVRADPNGTEFVIAVKDSPELDSSALVVGRVLDGMDVVARISQVKTVKENTSSPYFRVAKLIGDKRAVVAERGFNRPYSKVLVTNCGLLME